MQTGLREEIDGDFGEYFVNISDSRTAENHHEVDCALCGKVFYANKVIHENFLRVIEQGLDNPLVCLDCHQEIDAEAYENR